MILGIIPKLAEVFSENKYHRRIFLLIQLWYFTVTRKWILKGKEMAFNFSYQGRNFQFSISSSVDLAALYEVFVLEEYHWDLKKVPEVIIDLGAHIGDTALYYHILYPSAKIFAFEPAPASFKKLVKNTSSIKEIVPVQAALGKSDGMAQLNIVPSSLGNSLKMRDNSESSVTVPVYSLSSLNKVCDIHSADLIKFDIEGGEENFLGFQLSDLSLAYIGEVHLDLMSIEFNQFLNLFSHFNVEYKKLGNPNRYIVKAVK